MDKEVLPILHFVFINGKLPEITNDNSDIIKELEDNHCVYRDQVLRGALPANPNSKFKSQKQERWLVDEIAVNNVYGFTKKELMKGEI